MVPAVGRQILCELVDTYAQERSCDPLNEFLLGLLHLHSSHLSAGMWPPQTECSIHIAKFPVSFSLKYFKKLSSEVLLLFVLQWFIV